MKPRPLAVRPCVALPFQQFFRRTSKRQNFQACSMAVSIRQRGDDIPHDVRTLRDVILPMTSQGPLRGGFPIPRPMGVESHSLASQRSIPLVNGTVCLGTRFHLNCDSVRAPPAGFRWLDPPFACDPIAFCKQCEIQNFYLVACFTGILAALFFAKQTRKSVVQIPNCLHYWLVTTETAGVEFERRQPLFRTFSDRLDGLVASDQLDRLSCPLF